MSMNYLEKYEEQVDGTQMLWEMVKTLWKDITIEEFETMLEEEGYEDYYCRVLIALQDIEWMKKTYGGDGKGRLRWRYKQFQNGTWKDLASDYEKRQMKQLKILQKKYEDFLQNQRSSTQHSDNKS